MTHKIKFLRTLLEGISEIHYIKQAMDVTTAPILQWRSVQRHARDR